MTDTKSNNNERVMCILAYFIFFLPLLVIPESVDGKFHANQGLLLLLACIALNIIAIIPVLGWIVGILGWVFIVVLVILGIINASNMEMKELPLIGKIKIIK